MPRTSLRSDLTAARRSFRNLQRLLDRLTKNAHALELAAATNGSPVRGSRHELTLTPQRRARQWTGVASPPGGPVAR